MQRFRPLLLPGLFLLHLVALLAVVGLAPTEPDWALLLFVILPVPLGQLMLTAIWAGSGSEPALVRVPGCAVLAALCCLVSFVVLT